MLIVIIILIILAIVISIKVEDDHYEISLYSLAGAIFLGFVSLIMFFIIIVGYCDGYASEDKIAMYQKENKNIENQITKIVNNYQGYEKDIISNVADMETILIKIPELKSSELVKTQMNVYIENNNKIKKLKERQIDMNLYKWLLYFGGM